MAKTEGKAQTTQPETTERAEKQVGTEIPEQALTPQPGAAVHGDSGTGQLDETTARENAQRNAGVERHEFDQ